MKYPIGFTSTEIENKNESTLTIEDKAVVVPRKSLVQVYFEARDRSYAYYNDKFDLHKGDIVYVEGKLEGIRGCVIDVSYSFKIKLSDYMRVIGKADTDVKGEFYMANSYLITFDSSVLPYEKVLSWFKCNLDDDEEYIISKEDDYTVSLNNLDNMDISPDLAELGKEYYKLNKVRYISVNGNHGRAIVESGQIYEVEFDYDDQKIKNLMCNCYHIKSCEHVFATILQLRRIMDEIKTNYALQFEKSSYFASVYKPVFLSFVVDNKSTGRITLS